MTCYTSRCTYNLAKLLTTCSLTEDSIRYLREKDRRRLRSDIQELESCAFDAFRQRSALRAVIEAAAANVKNIVVSTNDAEVIEFGQNECGQK